MKSEIISEKLMVRIPGQNLYTTLLKRSWVMLLLCTTVIAGCKKVVEETGLKGICPVVISTDPAAGAINVSTGKQIAATFNEAMDPATINVTTFILKQGTNQISGTVTYTGVTATFTPVSPLAANTVYTATVTTGVKDPQRNAMIADYVWTFNTGAIPIVVSTDPPNGATDVPFNKIITATFSTTMDPATISSSSFVVRQGTAVIAGSVTFAGSIATFTPAAALAPNTAYTGTITTAAKDLLGNALASNYVWSFATGATPIVVSTDPADGASNVVLNKVISAVFNKTMNGTTINAATFTLKQGSNTVAGTVNYSGKTATFTPNVPLAINTLYTGTITAGAKDSSGNPLAADYNWTFTTGTAPIVVSTDPANGDVNVPLNKTVTASFSTAMNPATINATTVSLKQGTNAVAGTVTYSGTTASFKPAVALSPNTVYTGTVTTGAKDVSGNALAANYTWSFTTTGVPPTVISTDPANGATNVILSKVITATFSTVMDPSTINVLTYTLKQGINPVAGTVSYSGSTASFAPLADLAANTLYTATITTGAKDANGNSLVSNYIWSFTTTAAPVPPPASFLGTAALFGAFGGNAGITNTGINTVINNGSIGTTAAATLITGFHDGTTGDVYTETGANIGLVKGRIHTAPPPPGSAASFAIATQGLIDAQAAYLAMSPASKPGGSDPGAGELGNLTLPPGTYKSAGATFKITIGDLTLDAKGDPNAQWFFQTPAGLTVGLASAARSVKLINGALAKNVYWYVGSQAVINGAGGGVMTGTIIATSGITFSTVGNATQTVLNGRAISLVASVTMVNTTINVP